MTRIFLLFACLFLSIGIVCYANEIDYSSCLSIEDVIARETQEILHTHPADHDELIQLYASRGESYLLNPLDVPIFYEGNPLVGLNVFAVIPPYSIQTPEVNKKIEQIIAKELGVIGTIVKANIDNLTGFGSGNLMNIQIGKVSKWDGGELPITRVTLNIETSVIISKTNTKSNSRVWSINDFVDTPFDVKSEEETIGAVQNLLKEFVRSYKGANHNQSQKPTFYVYF